MLQKLSLATVAIIIAGPASAADLAVKAPAQAPLFMASPWDGLYIGVNVGFGSTDFTNVVFDTVTGSGVVGGVQAGYNKQFGTFVLGLETDFDATSIKNTTLGVDTKLPWFGTTRTRAGFLINPALLLYGTGGVAYGHTEASVPGATLTLSGVGWAAGAGLQYAFTPQWSLGAEYLHVDLTNISTSPGGSSKTTTDLGRATLNYKF